MNYNNKLDKWGNKTFNDLREQYDKYYKGGKNSLYNKQFNKVFIPTHDKNFLKKYFNKVLKEKVRKIKRNYSINQPTNNTIKIFDFGCGDGRLHILFEEYAKKLKRYNFNLELYLYDISKVGIEIYENKLIERAYKYATERKNNNQKIVQYVYKNNGYRGNTLIKNNLKVNFILGSANDDFSYIKTLINNDKEVDLSLCIYDVFNHIPYRKNRIALLQILNEISNHYTIFTIGTTGLFREEQKIYNGLRRQGFPLKLATSKGDIYYSTQNSENSLNESIYNFFHVYNSRELIKDFKNAGINIKYFGIAVITDYTKYKYGIIGFKIDEIFSRIMSKILPKKFLHKVGLDLIVIGKKN